MNTVIDWPPHPNWTYLSSMPRIQNCLYVPTYDTLHFGIVDGRFR
jgi:hypothetical protein